VSIVNFSCSQFCPATSPDSANKESEECKNEIAKEIEGGKGSLESIHLPKGISKVTLSKMMLTPTATKANDLKDVCYLLAY
jgi:hypothetical protein